MVKLKLQAVIYEVLGMSNGVTIEGFDLMVSIICLVIIITVMCQWFTYTIFLEVMGCKRLLRMLKIVKIDIF